MRYILRAGQPAYPLAETSKRTLLIAATLACAALAQAQTAPATTTTTDEQREDDVIVLSPFTVDATQDTGYQATQTLAGTRIRTNLAEVGSAISVLTKELITDVGGFNNETVLAYAVNTEVAGPRGNFSGANRTGAEGTIGEGSFSNPNGNTRVRGLTAADNTRDYFLSDIPWDGYNISRVDLQRGPNAILFGLGSPAGVINASTNAASFQNKGSIDATFDEFGTQRYSLDYNRNLIDRELGVRISLLDNNQKFQQRPAFSHDRRGFGAIKYAPAVLNKNGMTLVVSGNFEHGEIDSNRPRSVTPLDMFTQFWRPTSQGGINKLTWDPYREFMIEEPNATPDNPALEAQIAQFYQDYWSTTTGSMGGLMQLNNSRLPYTFIQPGIQRYLTRREDGTIIDTTADSSSGVWAGSDPRGVTGVQQWATTKGLPYAGAGGYRNETISDPSIFDFYNKLLDGPNKREWAHWNVYSVDLANTYFDNMLGYNLTAFQQNYDSGMWMPLGWDGTAIRIDNTERFVDGTLNPDVGRAFVGGRLSDMGSFTNKSDREAYRGTFFGEYNFEKRHSGWWARLLGEQRVTGVYSEEDHKSDYRSIKFADWDINTISIFGPLEKEGALLKGGREGTGPSFKYYISDDLRGLASPAGANVTNLGMPFTNLTETTAQIRYFDPTWTATNVDPTAPWDNPGDPNRLHDTTWFQSQNPANYRGWTTTQARYVTMNSREKVLGMSARDYLTNSASLTNFNVKSQVGVWQGAFWDRAVVGVYGYRKDKSYRYDYATSTRQYNQNRVTGGADLNPATYNYDNPTATVGRLETTTRNWSAMLHINKLLGRHDILPVNVRLYYNEGENFQPTAGRTDVYLRPLPPPGGSTTDKSIMISTKDDKYTLRVTQYETSIVNATSSDGALQADWALEQILGGNLGWGSAPGGIIRGYLNGRFSFEDYEDQGGDANRLRNSIIPAWMQFEKDLKAQFPDFVRAWMGPNSVWGTDDLSDWPAVSKPIGVTATEDSISEGYEVELIANPTKNWRLAVNASKTEAKRSNVPGPSWINVIGFINDRFRNTDAGMAPIWWPGNNMGLVNFGPYPWWFYPDWVRVNAVNGQSAGEIRKYHVNAITNYTFDTGMLKGVGVGAGYRWEDRSIIAYAPRVLEDGNMSINLNAPFYAPSESNIDLWVSYSRKLTKDLRWRIQLNVFNVGGKDKLVPITASIDYTKLDQLTNITPTTVVPMRAAGYSIRQGMSWQLSNTLEF